MAKKSNATAEHEADERELVRKSMSSAANRGGSPAQKKERRMTAGTYWLFQTGLYKRHQGRITRQVTFFALVGGFGFGCWRLSRELMNYGTAWQIGVPLAVFAACAWVAYRLVNLPRFADFLIAVEAEMAKVSWPTRSELIRSSMVVIATIVGLAAILFAYDWFWTFLFSRLGVVGHG